MALVYVYGHGFMAFARLFRNGNSLAPHIPAELAYGRTELELELEQELDIERVGDAWLRVAEA
jgi:hypothetical protein